MLLKPVHVPKQGFGLPYKHKFSPCTCTCTTGPGSNITVTSGHNGTNNEMSLANFKEVCQRNWYREKS